MSVFVDTGVFYAHHDTDASRHETAADALRVVLQSDQYGWITTSDYVYDEVVTLTQRRTGDREAGLEVGRRLRGDGYPDAIELLHTSRSVFDDAVAIQETYDDQTLSFTDAVTVATVEYHDLDTVLSFDDDFDGVTDRLSPATVVDG
ncbi:type II toxin-antitoxin system VapC family toxin [Halobaculum sp. MBLA0147]|uniref:type II toxin-antitoxin system VapC family toxin n=1 Tax=Halobaculum sp. MBLA0147 TaxID=3079934 RepID=UPI0035263A13